MGLFLHFPGLEGTVVPICLIRLKTSYRSLETRDLCKCWNYLSFGFFSVSLRGYTMAPGRTLVSHFLLTLQSGTSVFGKPLFSYLKTGICLPCSVVKTTQHTWMSKWFHEPRKGPKMDL